MQLILLIIFGIISGVLGGMGMGGGTLLIPLLTIFLSINQQVAQAINLISFLPMAVVALIIHIKNKFIVYKGILYIIIPAVLFATLGSFIAKELSGALLQKLFGGFLMFLSILQTILFFKGKK